MLAAVRPRRDDVPLEDALPLASTHAGRRRCRAAILDGHNDLVLRRWRGEAPKHIDLARAAEADFCGGFFALYVPSPDGASRDRAAARAVRGAARRRRSRATRRAASPASSPPRSSGLGVPIARRVDDLEPGRVTAIMHLEGADPLAPDLSDLQAWYDRGLRSIGIVWSRPNAFGEGVPFRFPASPDTGPGPDRRRPRARGRLQPDGHPRRRLAPERGRLLGRRRAPRSRRSSRRTRTPTR